MVQCIVSRQSSKLSAVATDTLRRWELSHTHSTGTRLICPFNVCLKMPCHNPQHVTIASQPSAPVVRRITNAAHDTNEVHLLVIRSLRHPVSQLQLYCFCILLCMHSSVLSAPRSRTIHDQLLGCKLLMSQFRCARSCRAAGSFMSLGTPTLSLKYSADATTAGPSNSPDSFTCKWQGAHNHRSKQRQQQCQHLSAYQATLCTAAACAHLLCQRSQ